MAALTFEQMRGYLHTHCGEAHARWCSGFPFTCDGECTDRFTFTTHDGREVDAVVTLHHEAMWPTLTYTARDGLPYRFDPSRMRAVDYEELNTKVRYWNNQWMVPEPIRRPTPPKEARR
jgi:hypothetical protein